MQMQPKHRRAIVIAGLALIFAGGLWYGIDNAADDAPPAAPNGTPPLMQQGRGQPPTPPQFARMAAAAAEAAASSSRSHAAAAARDTRDSPMVWRGAVIAQTLYKGKAIATALRKYAKEHKGNLPVVGPASPLSIQGILAPYLKDRTVFDPVYGYEGETPIFHYAFEGGRKDTNKTAAAEKVVGFVMGPGGGRAVIFADGNVRWQEAEPIP